MGTLGCLDNPYGVTSKKESANIKNQEELCVPTAGGRAPKKGGAMPIWWLLPYICKQATR